ncbi:alpha-1,2-fucosyltransferase, partial [Acinetobacter baumannii]|nr:alpha-1,2-fucosyltransferase [Acinetobacter baumannii]
MRYKPKMQPWLQEFPALWRLTVKEEDVSFLQPRTVEWGHDINEDFLYPDLKAFCREVLLAGSDFPRRWGTVVPDATVVNVRRGDYYSVPEHRAKYGMDIRG